MTYLKANLIVFLSGGLLIATIYGVFKLTGDSLTALALLLLLVLALNLLPPLLGSLSYRRRMNRRLAQSRYRRLWSSPAPPLNNSYVPEHGHAEQHCVSCGVRAVEDQKRLAAALTSDSFRSTLYTPDGSRDSGTAG